MDLEHQYNAVQKQYKTAQNLNLRISLHAKYSTNQIGFGNWLFSQYDLVPNMRILELGCGTGEMWDTKLHLLDTSIKLLLTDFSENMVSVVKDRFHAASNVSYEVVNIENIPYRDSCFDRVIANMMLYHVPDLDKGLSEAKRVLAEDGYFYCATYGEHGIMPFLAELLKDYNVKDTTNKKFTLQNGYDLLKEHFSHVERLDYEDSLAITDIEDLLNYIYSLTLIPDMAKLERETLKKALEQKMDRHVLNIPKEYGMFLCRK